MAQADSNLSTTLADAVPGLARRDFIVGAALAVPAVAAAPMADRPGYPAGSFRLIEWRGPCLARRLNPNDTMRSWVTAKTSCLMP